MCTEKNSCTVVVLPGVIWNLYSVREEINVRGLSVEAETLDVESAFVQKENVTSNIVFRILKLAQILGRLLGSLGGRSWGSWGHGSLHGRLGSRHWSCSRRMRVVCHVMLVRGVGWSRSGVRVGGVVVGCCGMGVSDMRVHLMVVGVSSRGMVGSRGVVGSRGMVVTI